MRLLVEMNNRSIQISFSLLLALAVTVTVAFGQTAERTAYIELQPKTPILNAAQFYVFRVDDEQAEKTTIGKVVQVHSINSKQTEELSARIKGGSEALKAIIVNSVSANKTLRPLVIKIKDFEITEKIVAGNKAEGRVALSLEFGLLRNDDFIKLDDYTANSTYLRKAGVTQAGTLLSGILAKGLIFIDNWMDSQADKNMLLAKAVKITFTDHKSSAEDDTIYYDVNRPLKWTDFRGKPHNSKYAAEIFASMGYDEDVKLQNGVICIKLDMKVYVPKSACWVRSDEVNSGSLSHEQHHFDIVKIVAEHFKQRILNTKLDIDNYDAPINMAYLDALREVYNLQKQYDRETAHSLNTYQQQQWDLRIEKELQQAGITTLTTQAADPN